MAVIFTRPILVCKFVARRLCMRSALIYTSLARAFSQIKACRVFIVQLQKNKNGFALIFVLVFVAMILGIIGDVVYQSQISARTSIQQKSEGEAEGAARTGLQFAKLLLALNNAAVKYQNNPLVPLPKDLYSMLNGMPIGIDGFDSINKLAGFNVTALLDPEILKALAPVKGYFVLDITPENSKFNLNILRGIYSNTGKAALLRLFSTTNNVKFLEQYKYTPERLVNNLVAYIKSFGVDSGNDGQVSSDYAAIGAKYTPKKNALESLGELRRIPGFNIDDIYNMYAPYFTVWPRNPGSFFININSAPVELIASIFTPKGRQAKDYAVTWVKFEQARRDIPFQKNNIGSWFAQNLKDSGDDNELTDIRKALFGVENNIFKVESRGVVNDTERKVTLVYQKSEPGNLPPPSTSGGADGSGASRATSTMGGSGIVTDSATDKSTNPGGITSSSGKNTEFIVLYNQWSQ